MGLACAAFSWGASSRAHLHLVRRPAAGGGAPSSEDERRALAGDALFPAASLRSAGVEAGALLLVRVPPGAGACRAVRTGRAGESCARGPLPTASCHHLAALALARSRAPINALSHPLADLAAVMRSLPPPVPPAQAPSRGPADARALSVSDVVGPTFEHEAREALSSVFREVCPWAADVSRLLSRSLDRDGNAREADVMCYVEGDTLGPCVGAPAYGVAVVAPVASVAPPLPAAALRADARFSPTDATRLGPHKYFLAEAYSGANEETTQEKVAQLETLCAFLRLRWMDQHGGEGGGGGGGAPAVDDATQLLGAVALVFSAGEMPRRLALDRATSLVARTAVGANLARLRAAGRLLVVVLDKTQSPVTFFQRAVAANLGRLAAIPEDVDAVRGEVGAVRDDVGAVRDEVGAVRDGLVRLEAAMQTLLQRRS